MEEMVVKLRLLDVLVNNTGWSKFVRCRKLDKLTEEILERT